MTTRIWEVRTVTACIGIFVVCIATAQSPSINRLQDRVSIVETCFTTRISELRASNQLDAQVDTVLLRIFLFEQIQKHLLGPNEGAGPFMTMEPEQFCQEKLVRPYIDASSATMKRRKSDVDVLAPAGTKPIESDSIFIELTQNITGRHVKGHSDITDEALRRIDSRIGFTVAACELMVRASQEPDLYRWKQERYHAHTPNYRAGDRVDRKLKIEQGKREFQQLIQSLRDRFKRYVEMGSFDRALFVLGVSAHAIQDLIYHRGITLQQHAGLSYATDPSRNPDLPAGPLEHKRWEEAIDYTMRVIESAIMESSVDRRLGLLNWTPGDKFSFRELAREVFGGDSEDISVSALISYWGMSVPYRTKERTLNELDQDDACSNEDGLACWIPRQILQGMFGK